MKKMIPILLIAALASCGSKRTEAKPAPTNDSNSTVTDTNTTKPITTKIDWESRAMDTIMSLPEVINLGNDIDKNSQGKNHLTAMVMDTPDDNGKGYYGIKVGEDNGESVVGMYFFNVYTPSMKITISDPISGDDLTLDEWRKQTNNQ